MNHEWMLHNSHINYFRNPFGAVPSETDISLKLEVWGENPTGVYLISHIDDVDHVDNTKMKLMKEEGSLQAYQCNLTAPDCSGLLWYYFKVVFSDGKIYYYGNNHEQRGGWGEIYDDIPPGYQITVYHPNVETPHWFKDAVVYQVFVDRFRKGLKDGRVLNPKQDSLIHSHWDNTPVYIKDIDTGEILRWDFFGGNLYGVREKLAYLKTLGVSVIYLNPVFESPSNHRYDVSDYHKVDPMVGNNDLFRRLTEEAAELGMYVLLDGVFSHTGSDSIYFNKEGNYKQLGAYQSKDSPYYNWYQFEEFPDKYASWWGVRNMPNVNELEPTYQDFVINNDNSVLKHWHNLGNQGWRLDVVDELPPEFLKSFYRTLKEWDSEAVVIGEVWEDASNKISYGERREYLLGEELDSVTNYPFRNTLIGFVLGNQTAGQTHQSLMKLAENYPTEYFYSTLNLLGTHDVRRILTVLTEELPGNLAHHNKKQYALSRLKLLVMWQMTFPGVPSIYYGDEAEIEGIEDPDNRRTYPWGKENHDLLNWYRELVSIRNHYDVFRTGHWKTVYTHGDVFGFLRWIDGDKDVFNQEKESNLALVLINRNKDQQVNITMDVSNWSVDSFFDILDNYRKVHLEHGMLKLTLRPLEGKVLLKDRWKSNADFSRDCGILLHPTSLPSQFGIGDIGREAYKLIDFLVNSDQGFWQILPVNPIGYGDSPYQCFSAFAGEPLLISPEKLQREGLLSNYDLNHLHEFSNDEVEYDKAREVKYQLYEQAFNNFQRDEVSKHEYQRFKKLHQGWLDEYALYMAVKEHFKGLPWYKWTPDIAFREAHAIDNYRMLLKERVEFHKFLQYKFISQWQELKEYANHSGIQIIGDLPIFVAHDSCDVWANRHLFQLDEEGKPKKVSGVPPDAFSSTGQLWGNPIYDWNRMRQDDYRWWRKRFEALFQLVDWIRIDHFRGFEAYWEIPAERENAVKGKWVKGPGEELFKTIKNYVGELPVIAEDLGVINLEVEEMKQKLDYPGMKILQFHMDHDSGEFKIPLWQKKTAAYTGTHDNDTILGWYRNMYPDSSLTNPKEKTWHYIEMLYHTDAQIAIVPMQDILCLDSRARMNTPGTVGNNWKWRFTWEQVPRKLTEGLRELVVNYHR